MVQPSYVSHFDQSLTPLVFRIMTVYNCFFCVWHAHIWHQSSIDFRKSTLNPIRFALEKFSIPDDDPSKAYVPILVRYWCLYGAMDLALHSLGRKQHVDLIEQLKGWGTLINVFPRIAQSQFLLTFECFDVGERVRSPAFVIDFQIARVHERPELVHKYLAYVSLCFLPPETSLMLSQFRRWIKVGSHRYWNHAIIVRMQIAKSLSVSQIPAESIRL